MKRSNLLRCLVPVLFAVVCWQLLRTALDVPTQTLGENVLVTLRATGGLLLLAGGSLLLIPMCCALFGITNDIAMQVVGIGFIIGVIQDSCETGLNSSSDVVFTATAEYRQLIKEGKEVHLGQDAYSADELA